MAESPDAASVALIDADGVLLIQRAQAPYHGLWTLPGGRLEPGETAAACAAREVREELGLAVHALLPINRLLVGDGGFLLQVFGTRTFEGKIAVSEEIADYRWVGPAGLGTLNLTPHLQEVLERAFLLFDRR